MDLVKKAKSVRGKKDKPDAEVCSLALAWARGEVTTSAVGEVLGVGGNSIYSRIALAFREAVRTGRIVETTKKAA